MLDFDNPFQAAAIALFIVFAVAGVAVFALNPGILGGGGSGTGTTQISMWGTLSESTVNKALQPAGINTPDSRVSVDYRHIDGSNLRSELVNALAKNKGPDALLIPHTRIMNLEEFIVKIGPKAYSPRQFRNNFIPATEVFTHPDGIAGLPFAVDPLVMYWNRDMLSAAGFVSPPKRWSQMQEYVDALTRVNKDGAIQRSAIAMGTTNNISASKSILSALLMQAGNPIVEFRQNSNRFESVLADTGENRRQAQAALRQYTQYANPSASLYSWNNSFSSARSAFAANKTALYLDSGQAIDNIRAQNPNLNFDVTTIPQRNNGQERTYGTVYGITILKRVRPVRRGNVLAAVKRLVAPDVAKNVLQKTNLTPVRKQVVSTAQPENPYKSTLLNAAVTARAWTEPGPARTKSVFKEMINNVISGQRSITESVDLAGRSLNEIFDNIRN